MKFREGLDDRPSVILFVKQPTLPLKFILIRDTLFLDPAGDLLSRPLDQDLTGTAFD